MSRYFVTPAAQSDLDGIWDYTKQVWGEDQAERYLMAIYEGCEALAAGRKVGRNADRFRADYYRYAIGSHFVFYTLSDSGTVQVMRILHQRMNLKSRLNE